MEHLIKSQKNKPRITEGECRLRHSPSVIRGSRFLVPAMLGQVILLFKSPG